jgi:hypothetical protein
MEFDLFGEGRRGHELEAVGIEFDLFGKTAQPAPKHCRSL